MMVSCIRPVAPMLAIASLLAGCGGGKNEGEGGEAATAAVAPADVMGYYEYADAVRGRYSLAILEDNRFLLVVERSAPEQPALGAVGWWVLRDDEIMLSAPNLDIQGTVGEGGLLELTFVDPMDELATGVAPPTGAVAPGAPAASAFAMPFKRVTGSAASGEGGGGGGQGGPQGGGGGEGGSGEGGGGGSGN